jgi:hypothetical protein
MTRFVTGDSAGNLAYSNFGPTDFASLQSGLASAQSNIGILVSDVAGLKEDIRRTNGGIAAAVAIGGAAIVPDSPLSISFNLSTYRGEQGFSGSVLGKVSERVYLSAGVAGSTVGKSTTGRIGVTFGL